MLSQSHSNEQDETNGSSELQQRMSKKRDLGKKRTQSPKVNRSIRKKIQKFLQGSGENTAYDSQHSPVEIEDDMFICGIKRDPVLTSVFSRLSVVLKVILTPPRVNLLGRGGVIVMAILQSHSSWK